MSLGVIIARFQTPYLHEGHKNLIDRVAANHSKLVMVLGISPVTGSRNNPYDYFTREKMIKKTYPEVLVLPLHDQPSDLKWSLNLDRLLGDTFPTEQFELYGSRDSFIPYYHGKFKTVELPEHGDYNSTELRQYYATKALDSEDFRTGIIYAYHNQYPKVYSTVDIAVFRNNKTELLLGKKLSENKWRFVGGFADPDDNSFEQTAKRELLEECGQIEVSEMCYEKSLKIDDWRYRTEIDKIITNFFTCDYMYGVPEPNDDIDELKWFKLNELEQMILNKEISEAHVDLFQFLVDKYFTKTLKFNGHETEQLNTVS